MKNMKATKKTTKALFALAFSLMLLVGDYSTVRAQQTEREPAPQAENGGVDMMEDCPMMQQMMQDSDMMKKMKEACPMMTEDMMKEGMGMQEMMKNCPMMKEMMGQMMENCPMMKGMMQDSMMQDSMMQGMNAAPEVSGERVTATLTADSVQVVQITVGPSGFEPKQIVLEAGVPARLVFTRTTDGTCAKQVQIPAFDVQKTDLPLNEPVSIELTPAEAGTFTFACGMDMLKGAIVVKS